MMPRMIQGETRHGSSLPRRWQFVSRICHRYIGNRMRGTMCMKDAGRGPKNAQRELEVLAEYGPVAQ
jgi:hypothetical protein